MKAEYTVAEAKGIGPGSIGYQVRLSRIGRENVETKATRYLVEGRVQIRYCGVDGCRAFARGSGHTWRVECDRGRWSCDCPAKDRCSHIAAVQRVVVVGAG